MHEQIENEYIIGLLQQRSRTVYNVHSDNKLSEMLSLFEKGLKNVKVQSFREKVFWDGAVSNCLEKMKCDLLAFLLHRNYSNLQVFLMQPL